MYRYAKFSVLALSLVAVVSSAALAGPVGGTEWKSGTVDAGEQFEFESRIWSNRPLIVQLTGDGDSELDLYVYDMYGTLLDSDTAEGSDGYVQISNPNTPRVTIVIVNRDDVSNEFSAVVE